MPQDQSASSTFREDAEMVLLGKVVLTAIPNTAQCSENGDIVGHRAAKVGKSAPRVHIPSCVVTVLTNYVAIRLIAQLDFRLPSGLDRLVLRLGGGMVAGSVVGEGMGPETPEGGGTG